MLVYLQLDLVLHRCGPIVGDDLARAISQSQLHLELTERISRDDAESATALSDVMG